MNQEVIKGGDQDFNIKGFSRLSNPLLNKGTAFTLDERKKWNLEGLLPNIVETLEEQVIRSYESYSSCDTPYGKYLFLRDLQDRNEVLYYALLSAHIEEMLPIVYTPTVADGCRHYSRDLRRSRGLIISLEHRGRIREVLRNRSMKDVDVIVVTDGERILGIGDQGVGGMGIPIGKLALYTLVGGIDPKKTLPITLDVGTNNENRLNDPTYVGIRQKRIEGAEYDSFIEEFVQAVKEELPGTLLQWEDFAKQNARPILEKYRDELLTFNDDIQGTAAVALSAVMAASRALGKQLREHTIVMLGAGAASIGVADYLRAAMVLEGATEEEARSKFYIVNSKGILHDERTDLTPDQMIYAQPANKVKNWPKTHGKSTGLYDVLTQIEASVLIGLSTVGGAFFEGLVHEMARKCLRPIIFPLSNPTSKAEALPEDLLKWTNGRALVAAGSPFDPVLFAGTMRSIAQCNNVFIFPAVGMGLVASQATRVSDTMMLAAANALSQHSPALENLDASLLPSISNLPKVASDVSLAVALQAVKEGLAPNRSEKELKERIALLRWDAKY